MTKCDKHTIIEGNICTVKLKKDNEKETIKLIVYKTELLSNNFKFYEENNFI